MKDRFHDPEPLFLRSMPLSTTPLRFPNLDALPRLGAGAGAADPSTVRIAPLSFDRLGEAGRTAPVAHGTGAAASLTSLGAAHADAEDDGPELAGNIVEISVQAYAEGFSRGRSEGLVSAQDEVRGAIGHLLQAAGAVREHRAKTVAGLEAELVELSLLIAERVLHGEVSARGHDIAQRLANHACARLGDSERLTVFLSEADYGALAPAPASRDDRVVFVADPALARGDAVVEGDHGRVDARLAAQMDEIKETLLAPSVDRGSSADEGAR